MLPALLLAAGSFVDWVPARWMTADPNSLALLEQTPVNCLLLEADQWSADFGDRARLGGIDTLGVIRPNPEPVVMARRALAAKLTGVALEGEFPAADVQAVREVLAASNAPVIEILPRRLLRPEESQGVLATHQNVWPGIPVEKSGAAKAGPTGSPWVSTNTGFLLFARSAAARPVWVANLPPADQALRVENYLQAICDAAVVGARWVLALDPGFNRRLLERAPEALQDWRRIAAHLRYFETHREWRSLRAHRPVAVVQDADSGALVSGGLLDMIAVKHTAVRVVPRGKLSDEALRGSRMVLNLQSQLLSPAQKEVLIRFTSAGGVMLTSPPEVQLPALRDDEITIDEKELKEIDYLWRGINSMIAQGNPGIRVYHGSGMLAHQLASDDGKRLVIHLVNYTNYPVENVTVRFPDKIQSARLLTPESSGQDLQAYSMERGTAVDIDEVPVCATLIVE